MNETSNVSQYMFVAGGAHTCERCAALNNSTWKEPPEPPHAHCECEIKVVPVRPRGERACGDNVWTLESVAGNSTVHYGDPADPSLEWGFIVTVECWNGTAHQFEFWVDMGKDSDWPPTMEGFEAMMAYSWNEVYEAAESVAAQVCPQCAPPRVS